MDYGFLMGAATAAHQVEGNNINSDCWVMENLPESIYREPSGLAADHYHRYKEDIDYLAAEGLNTYRFSIEWARVEPEEGRFDEVQLEHYRDMIDYCVQKGVVPIVTLHHFSTPVWVIRKGGWKSETIVYDFADYCRETIKWLGEKLTYVCTINEANMGLQIQKIIAEYQRKEEETDNTIQVGLNLKDMARKMETFQENALKVFGRSDINSFQLNRTAEEELLVMKAHQEARRAIKEERPELKVGLTLSLFDIQALSGGEKLADELWYEDFGLYFPYMQDDDFIGVQNYTRKVVGSDGIVTPENAIMTEAGYEYWPMGVANVVRRVASLWKKEILITENGISTSNDEIRVKFITEAINEIRECMKEGIPVKAYCHWSLLDNFEWQLGYSQKFGLIAVDRDTMERTVKPSMHVLGKLFREMK